MSGVIAFNAATMSIAANTTTSISGVSGSNPGPQRILIRTNASGVKIGGKALDDSGTNYGFELLPDVEYSLDLRLNRQDYNGVSADSAEGTLYVRNTTGSAVTVWWISTPLER